MNKDFQSGLTFWLKGWAYLLRHPLSLLAAVTPITIAVTAAAYAYKNHYDRFPKWIIMLLDFLNFYQGTVWDLLRTNPLMATAVAVGITGILLTIYCTHSVIAIPFYIWVVEKAVGIHKDTQDDDGENEPSITLWRVIRIGLIKTMILGPFGGLMFAFAFTPAMNLIGATLLIIVWAYDILEYGFEVYGRSVRDRLEYVSRHRNQWLGMATGLALTLILPPLTLLVIPGAVVGAALLLKVDDETRTSTSKDHRELGASAKLV